MTDQLQKQLRAELQAFTKLDESSCVTTFTDAYNQVLGSVLEKDSSS